MSLEEAIRRKIKFGGSFCSYTFTPLPQSSPSTVIKLNHLCSKTVRQDCSSFLQLRIPKKQKINKNNKSNLTTRSISYKSICNDDVGLEKIKNKYKDNRMLCGNIGEGALGNAMEEYLGEFKKCIKWERQFNTNQVQNIPKYLQISVNDPKHSNAMKKISQRSKFDYQKFNNITIHHNFNPNTYPHLFFQQSPTQTDTSPFINFIIINIHTNKYIRQKTPKKLFEQLPIKSYQQKLNNFSICLEDNIFYIALSKDIKEGKSLPYTESFFWIGKPIKHNERINAIQIIKKFILQCINRCKKICQTSAMQKIWIVDFNGKISYITYRQIQNDQNNQINQMLIRKDPQIINKNLNQKRCFMFFTNINKGQFYNVIGKQNQFNNQNQNRK